MVSHALSVWLLLLLTCVVVIPDRVSADAANQQSISIGVLAYNGKQQALTRWKPTADYLAEHIQSYSFQIIPLTHEEMLNAINKNQLAFILTNPGHYIGLEVSFGATRIATFRSQFHEAILTQFGSVIFTRADSGYLDFDDLRGRSMAAVSDQAFGGFQLAYSELLEHGINLKDDLTLMWLGFPQSDIVRAVISGAADSGTVRSGVLEKMAASGELDLSQIHVLGPRTSDAFPLLHSTVLYPEWPIARLPHTDPKLAKQVAITLLEMPETSEPAVASGGAGWTIPLDYLKVHELFRELQVEPYPPIPLELKEFWQGYRHWVILLGLLFLFSLSVMLFTLRINRQLKRSESSLSEHGEKLETTIEKRTNELSQANQALLKDIESRVQFETALHEGCDTLQAMNRISTRHDLTREQRIQSMLDLACQYLGEDLALLSLDEDSTLVRFTASSGQENLTGPLVDLYARLALEEKNIVRRDNLECWKSYVACYINILEQQDWLLELGTPIDPNHKTIEPKVILKTELGSRILNLFVQVIANELTLYHYETNAGLLHRETMSRFVDMTDRELEVLQLVSNGEPNKSIARILDISIKTVELHRSNLLRKTRASSSVQLIKLATQSRVIN